MDTIKQHGAKALALLLSFLTAGQGYDPQALVQLLGEQGHRWVAFGLSVLLLAHTTLIKPSSGTDEPSPPSPVPPRQQGRIRLGWLVALLLIGLAALAAVVTAPPPSLETPHTSPANGRSRPISLERPMWGLP